MIAINQICERVRYLSMKVNVPYLLNLEHIFKALSCDDSVMCDVGLMCDDSLKCDDGLVCDNVHVCNDDLMYEDEMCDDGLTTTAWQRRFHVRRRPNV